MTTSRQLNGRCGPLSEATTAQIRALPLEQLKALAEEIGQLPRVGTPLLYELQP